MTGKTTTIVLLVAAFSLLLPAGFALPSEEAVKAGAAIDAAKTDLQEMTEQDLPATRYGDALAAAEQLYEAQLALEKSGGKPDYAPVLEKSEEMKRLKRLAFRALDELAALEVALNRTAVPDKEPALELYWQAKEEFEAERYEESLELIDETYGKISELEALQTKVKAFYEATSRTVLNFLRENWRSIAAVAVAVAAIAALGYDRFARLMLERKIRDLELRKESIRKLMAGAQKEFFERGDISESTYQIKMKKYGELLRDINRQVPMLVEELAMRTRRNRGRVMKNEEKKTI